MSITLTELDDGRIIQRFGAVGTIPISGTYVGSPTAIEARIVNDGTSTEVVTWTVIDSAPSGGVFSGNLANVPQGGWYNIQVRFANDPATVDNGVNKVGVGILVGCIGQSNIYNWFAVGDGTLTPSPLIRKYYNGTQPNLGVKVKGWNTLPSSSSNGAISFANELVSIYGVPIGLLDHGWGGKALRPEADKSTNGNYWLNNAPGLVYSDFVNDAVSLGGLEFVVWIQGERDAQNAEDGSTKITYDMYRSGDPADPGLEYFITGRVRADIPNKSQYQSLPFFVVYLGSDTGTAIDDDWFDIRRAQLYVVENVADVYPGASMLDLPKADSLHYTAAGYTSLGLRCARAIAQSDGLSTYGYGPKITRATINGTDILLSVDHRSGTDFSSVGPYTGFKVYDGGIEVTPITASKNSASEIKLTLPSVPSGVVTVRYQYGAAPDVTAAVKDNSVLSLPLIHTGDVPVYSMQAGFYNANIGRVLISAGGSL